MLYCDQDLQPIKSDYSFLVVEHLKTFNKQLSTLLKEYKHYKVSSVFTFKEALKKLEDEHYDFIFLDLNLPNSNVDTLLSTIQSLSDAKIIALTSELEIQMREDLFKKGVLDYFLKTSPPKEILNTLHHSIRILEKNSASSVLIVDDSKFMAKRLEKILQVRNYNTTVVYDIQHALTTLQTTIPNALVVDIGVSAQQGLKLIQEIQKLQTCCHIPIIVISATNDPEILPKALKMGASDFIRKPFNIEELTLKVDLAVERNRKYLENICSRQMLSEYKEAIDESALVSKTNTKGIITYANEMFCKISGYSQEELIGKPHNVVRHPDMPSSAFKEMWQTIQSKKIWQGTIKNRRKNGESYYVKSTIKPILNVDGEILEYIAIRTDITELETYKEIIEKNLNISNNNLHYLRQYENAVDEFVAIMKTNTNNEIMYINDNFHKLTGYTRKELYGKNCRMLRAQKHIDRGDCDKILDKLRHKEKISILFENVTKNGDSYYMDTKIYPLIDKEGTIQEFLHIMYNVTEIIQIHEELEKTQKEIIYTMGEIGESRSQETGNHVKRVAKYSKILALAYGLDEKEADMLFGASPMHDIGKVGIPDSILKKPGKLTDEEWLIMRTHSEIGYNILKHSNRPILQTAAIVAYTHHEKYDGSGYPQGLQGEDIHIYGRITAIADVFDALGSDRVYKKAWKLEKILQLFKEEKGKHFDPKLVDLLFENLDKILEVRNEFRDIK